MESANLHHHNQHELQDQLVGSSTTTSSSSLSTPSWYGPATNHHQYAWTPNTTNTLNTGNNFNDYIINEENLCHTTDSTQKNNIQQIGFQYWTSSKTTPGSCFSTSTTTDQSEDCYPKFTEMMTNNSSSITTEENDQKHHFNDHLTNEKLLLKTLSSSAFEMSNGNDQFQFNDANFGNIPSRPGSFSQIFPSINISNLSSNNNTRPFSNISSSINMNLEALDLLTSSRFCGSFSDSSQHENLGFVKELHFVPHHMQQSVHRPPSSPSYKVSPFINRESKRTSNTTMDPKPSQAIPKKPRLETRACPPFKVRKEKLGDRIAALQQLVAPFGKTDTASVLMEAIGYIKFLQNQVETLSVPYMKSSSNKTPRTPQLVYTKSNGKEEPTRDLKSRGLCLVPLSCMSYVTNDNGGGGGGGGGGIWPHVEYHGCT